MADFEVHSLINRLDVHRVTPIGRIYKIKSTYKDETLFDNPRYAICQNLYKLAHLSNMWMKDRALTKLQSR